MLATAPLTAEEIVPIRCFHQFGDCYEYDWLFLRASVIFILVAGGFVARRWHEVPVVAFVGVAATYVMWQARMFGLVGKLSNEPFLSPVDLGTFALFYLMCLTVATVAYFAKRLAVSLWARSFGTGSQ